MSLILERLSKWTPGGWRRLNPEQRRSLARAIRAACPNPGQLGLFTSEWLNVDLVDIIKEGEYPVMIDRLIVWLESSSRLDELLDAILRARPENSLVVDPVTKIRSHLPLAVRPATADPEAVARALWPTNAGLVATLFGLAAVWLLVVHSPAAALGLVGAWLVLHVIAALVIPVLALYGRRVGRAVFVVSDHRATSYALIAALLALLLFVYPFVGVRRIESKLGSQAVPVELVERTAEGDRVSKSVRLSPGHPIVRPYLTHPGDRRSVFARAEDRETPLVALGPWRRTALIIGPDTPPRASIRVVIVPTRPLVAKTQLTSNYRLVVKAETGRAAEVEPFRIEPYHGQLVWLAARPLADEPLLTNRYGYVFTAAAAASAMVSGQRRAVAEMSGWGPLLAPHDRLAVSIEIKKIGSAEWKPISSTYPMTVTVNDFSSDPTALQEVMIHAD